MMTPLPTSSLSTGITAAANKTAAANETDAAKGTLLVTRDT